MSLQLHFLAISASATEDSDERRTEGFLFQHFFFIYEQETIVLFLHKKIQTLIMAQFVQNFKIILAFLHFWPSRTPI